MVAFRTLVAQPSIVTQWGCCVAKAHSFAERKTTEENDVRQVRKLLADWIHAWEVERSSKLGRGLLVIAVAVLVGGLPGCSETSPSATPPAPLATSSEVQAAVVDPHRQLLDALWMVEASRRLHPPDGDGGLSIGPYQISRAYWKDATEFDPQLGGSYEDCRDKAYAEEIVLAYWRRYIPGGTDEDRARVHNGGPQGHKKEATLKYWEKVERELKKQANS